VWLGVWFFGVFCRGVVWRLLAGLSGIGMGLVWVCVRCAHGLDWDWFFFCCFGFFLGFFGHDVSYMGEGLRGGGAG